MEKNHYERCQICDWNAAGMCDNYEIDRYQSTGKGAANYVEWDNSRRIFICAKCTRSVDSSARQFKINDEVRFLESILEQPEQVPEAGDFTDAELSELQQLIADQTKDDVSSVKTPSKNHPWRKNFAKSKKPSI